MQKSVKVHRLTVTCGVLPQFAVDFLRAVNTTADVLQTFHLADDCMAQRLNQSNYINERIDCWISGDGFVGGAPAEH